MEIEKLKKTNLNIFQKFRFLKEYRKTIHQYKEVIEKDFNMRIDWVNRCYTVLNFDEDLQEDLRKYGYSFLDNEVRKYIRRVQDFYKEVGLLELVGYSTIDQLDETNVLIVFEYAHLNTKHLFIYKIISYALLGIGALTALIILI